MKTLLEKFIERQSTTDTPTEYDFQEIRERILQFVDIEVDLFKYIEYKHHRGITTLDECVQELYRLHECVILIKSYIGGNT